MKDLATDSAAKPRVRALAFAGGSFDTARHLGVAHALLVARGIAPDYVAGISAGAINAAALAEILQAGHDLPEEARRNVQIETFRKFLAAFEELPDELLRTMLPDAYEIKATKPLEPIDLPVHFDLEREEREAASQRRAGLIRLMNQLLDIRLPVSAIAWIVNRILTFIGAAEVPDRAARLRRRGRALLSLWCIGIRYMAALGAIAWPLAGAAFLRPSWRRRLDDRAVGSLIGRWRTLQRTSRWLRDRAYTVAFALVWTLIAPPVALAAWAVTLLRKPGSPRSTFWRRRLDRVLEYYRIADSLGDSYVVKERLIRCFDPDYYGRPDLKNIVAKALDRKAEAAKAAGPTKTLGVYQERQPAIVVAPIAADVASGELTVLPADIAVVDALLAATAVVPIFRAVKLRSREFTPDGESEKTFIDGLNVSNEPIGALVDLLRTDPDRRQLLAEAGAVDIYPVSDLGAGVEDKERSGILQTAARALALRSLRDATMEQRYTALYTRALPKGSARQAIAGKTYVLTNVVPIGIEQPAQINRKVLAGVSQLKLKKLIEQAVADGCRASLEAFMPRAIAAAAGVAAMEAPATRPAPRKAVHCRTALLSRFKGNKALLLKKDKHDGPGLPEICGRCALGRPAGREPESRRHLQVPELRSDVPEWPLADRPATRPRPAAAAQAASPEAAAPEPVSSPAASTGARSTQALPSIRAHPGPGIHDWPLERRALPGSERPLCTLLFGGGVFRGVFHMGVMNALNELGVEPDLVAGSSVGSIIAAMIAQAFTQPAERRQVAVAHLAATFLAIDRLVMTDRLADFVRGMTLRAADAHFSLRDLDLLLRRYDEDAGVLFGERARRVVAGLERLFYLSPMCLGALVQAARARRSREFRHLVSAALQQFLDRGGIGQEILGTEPLSMLIEQEVIHGLERGARDLTFDSFAAKGIQFLATVTNLTRGRLEVLGEDAEGQAETSLLHGLLASSAFPAVFRPREQWQVLRSAMGTDQYIDGGTIDNLPLDVVARFLDGASQGDRPTVARRPTVGGVEVPHLLFTASLEVDKTWLPEAGGGVAEVAKSFLALRKRARTFSYNRKIDAFAGLQRDLREIHQSERRSTPPPEWQPVDLHVVAVRPRWLCNTFGFHPMLGFRRRKQAESIAHGCASTIATFHQEATRDGAGPWLKAWGVRGLEAVDGEALTSRTDHGRPALNPRRDGKPPGVCWFRDALCPFSAEALAGSAALSGEEAVLRELPRIYEACGRADTHRPPHAVQKTVE